MSTIDVSDIRKFAGLIYSAFRDAEPDLGWTFMDNDGPWIDLADQVVREARHLSPPAQRFTEAERELLTTILGRIEKNISIIEQTKSPTSQDGPTLLRMRDEADTLRAMLDVAPPTVDVESIMNAVELYARAEHNIGWATARGSDDTVYQIRQDAERYKAAIRSALEGTR